MTSALSQVLASSGEPEGGAGHHPVVNELPFEPIWFGVIAMVAFLALLGLLWSFRNTLALDPHGVADGHADPDTGRSAT